MSNAEEHARDRAISGEVGQRARDGVERKRFLTMADWRLGGGAAATRLAAAGPLIKH